MILATRRQYTRNLEQFTGWINPNLGMKERCRAVKAVDQRMSESRLVEDALLNWLPIVERRLGLDLNDRRRKISG